MPTAIQAPAGCIGMRQPMPQGPWTGSLPHLSPLVHTPTPPYFCAHRPVRQGPCCCRQPPVPFPKVLVKVV